ncbi:MAG: hypothetical protein RIB80_01070 [Rhodospirillales bacterium]
MRNVSRKIRNAMRRERRANPSADMIAAREAAETAEKRRIRLRAEELLHAYGAKGATWAECFQAVKTNWVGRLMAKYTD